MHVRGQFFSMYILMSSGFCKMVSLAYFNVETGIGGRERARSSTTAVVKMNSNLRVAPLRLLIPNQTQPYLLVIVVILNLATNYYPHVVKELPCFMKTPIITTSKLLSVRTPKTC